VLKKVSLRKIIALQLRKYLEKNFQVYAIHMSGSTGDKGKKLEDYPML